MGLLDAIKFVRGAVRGQPVYGFDEGRVFARAPAILASYPVEHILGTFGMATSDIDGALSRMKAEPVASPGDGTLLLRSGRIRSTIDLLEYTPPGVVVEVDDSWVELPVGLHEALIAAAPFISDSGTWNRSVKLDRGRVLAMSGRSAAAIEVPDLDVPGHVALTDDTVEYLSKLDTPSRWIIDGTAVAFSWTTGGWARCQSTALEWPNGIFDKVMALGPHDDPPTMIDDDFRDAFADVVALVSKTGEGTVRIGPNGMMGKSEHAQHVVDVPLTVEVESVWSIRTLKPVVAVAQRWWPNPDGPSRFEGVGIVGVAMPQRRTNHG